MEDNQMILEWDEAAQQGMSITLEAMDLLVTELRNLKDLAEEAQARADEVRDQYNSHRQKVQQVLEANGRKNYAVEGVGSVYISEKEVYRVPKSNEEKVLLFNYIKEQYGSDALLSLTSIHSATLTSWANAESEKGVMSIPGLEAPTMVATLNIRKK